MAGAHADSPLLGTTRTAALNMPRAGARRRSDRPEFSSDPRRLEGGRDRVHRTRARARILAKLVIPQPVAVCEKGGVRSAMTQGATRARVLHWFVRGGIARTPDGKEIPIDVDPIVIGRDEGAQIRLADPEVSAIHCELRAVNEGVLVKDLGSTNGTFVGSVRIREGVVTTAAEVLVGQTRISIEPTGKQRVDVGYSDRFGGLVGSSPKMRRVFGVLEKVANTALSILILGETGTGKEVVAKSVHDASDRKGGPFVVLDCGSIPASLAESILFGHEKGVFTGATERKKGALAEAHGGTLFLDELGELPLELQPKLLRVLAERQVKRVGGNTLEPIDVRVLAATRRDLGVEMNAGRFRSDLFFRIAQVRVELPALRERLGDLPLLVEEICKKRRKTRGGARRRGLDRAAPRLLRLAGQRPRARQRRAGRGDPRRHAGGHRRRAHARSRLRRRRAATRNRRADGVCRGQARRHLELREGLFHAALPWCKRQRQRDGAAERDGAAPRARLPAQIRHRKRLRVASPETARPG